MLAFFTWEITSDLFFGTVSSVFSLNMFKKQDGMLAVFLYCAGGVLAQNCKKQNEMLAFFTPKNSGRLLCFVVLRHRFSRQTCLQNKTKCPTFLLKSLKFYAFSHFLSFGGYPLKTRYILKGWHRCLNLLLHVLQTPPTSIWGVSMRPCWHFLVPKISSFFGRSCFPAFL